MTNPGSLLAGPNLSAEQLLNRPEGPDLSSALRNMLTGPGQGEVPRAGWLQEAGVPAIYEKRGYSPVFLGSMGNFESALRLMESVEQCGRHGFDPDRFHATHLQSALDVVPAPARGFFAKLRNPTDVPGLAGKLAQVDARLLDLYLDFAFELAGLALVEKSEGESLRESVLAGLAGGAVPDVESFAPRHPQYQALQAGLETYRRVVEAGGWPTIDEGETLRPGETGQRVIQLRARLDAEDQLLHGRGVTPSADPSQFDSDLKERVKAFQTRHALDSDGAVGKMTLEALNVPADGRLRQIRTTMARWRRGPRDNPEYRVEANIPGMLAFLYRDGRRVVTFRTVVGSGRKTGMWKGKQARAETPELEDEIETIVVNPRWYVPESIVRTELKSSDAKKPGFLDRGGYEWYDPKSGESGPASEVPDSVWTNASSDLRIRQQPGTGNALGRLKFLFPNSHAVYMHDTPEKKLFARGRRNYSHGCVRVENPAQLADSLLAHSNPKPARSLERMLAVKERVTITLNPAVPIRFLYRTVWVQDDGTVDFLPDIYEWDASFAGLESARRE